MFIISKHSTACRRVCDVPGLTEWWERPGVAVLDDDNDIKLLAVVGTKPAVAAANAAVAAVELDLNIIHISVNTLSQKDRQ